MYDLSKDGRYTYTVYSMYTVTDKKIGITVKNSCNRQKKNSKKGVEERGKNVVENEEQA